MGDLGSRTLSRAVADLHERVLADGTLAGWFEGVDMARLRVHQVDVLLVALRHGRLTSLEERELGERLASGHAHLALDDAAYDALVAHLLAALGDLGLADVELQEASARLERLRSWVV